MQGLILAAGLSTRLNQNTRGQPKWLADVGETTLLEYQLEMFHRFQIHDVCAILGYGAERIIPRLQMDGCTYRINEQFAETNSLHSLSLAWDWLETSFLLHNCDVLADFRIYQRLIEQPGNVLAYDSSSGNDREEMKVCFENNGPLRLINKHLSPTVMTGENVGLVKIEEDSIDSLITATEEELAKDGAKKWATAALERLTRSRKIFGVDVRDLPWIEIDFPEDLERARSVIWKQICLGHKVHKFSTGEA